MKLTKEQAKRIKENIKVFKHCFSSIPLYRYFFETDNDASNYKDFFVWGEYIK